MSGDEIGFPPIQDPHPTHQSPPLQSPYGVSVLGLVILSTLIGAESVIDRSTRTRSRKNPPERRKDILFSSGLVIFEGRHNLQDPTSLQPVSESLHPRTPSSSTEYMCVGRDLFFTVQERWKLKERKEDVLPSIYDGGTVRNVSNSGVSCHNNSTLLKSKTSVCEGPNLGRFDEFKSSESTE